MEGNTITQQIMAIQRDPYLTDVEKAKKRQELLSGKWVKPAEESATGDWACLRICLPVSFAALATDLFEILFQRQKVQQLQPQRSLICSTTVSSAQCAWTCVHDLSR